MKKSNRKFWRNAVALVGVVLVLTVPGATAFARNLNPGVLPPTSHAFGMTYGEWSAKHWQWDYSMPADHHPLFDTADCSTGQSGKVWFLGGTFTVVQNGNTVIGTANRNCTVPTGKAIFFPIIDAECATAEGNGSTEEELSACAKDIIDHTTELNCEIDGVSVQNVETYRVQSPLFVWGPLPANNIFQDPVDFPAGTTSDSVSDGFFLMLAPLSAGQHTIHFTGEVVFSTATGDPFDFDFKLDINYNLNIVGGKK